MISWRFSISAKSWNILLINIIYNITNLKVIVISTSSVWQFIDNVVMNKLPVIRRCYDTSYLTVIPSLYVNFSFRCEYRSLLFVKTKYRMNERKNRHINGQTDGQKDVQTGGQKDWRTERRTNRQTYVIKRHWLFYTCIERCSAKGDYSHVFFAFFITYTLPNVIRERRLFWQRRIKVIRCRTCTVMEKCCREYLVSLE